MKHLLLCIFIAAALGAGIFLVFPASTSSRASEDIQHSRIIIPSSPQFLFDESPAEQIARIEQMTLRAPLADAEILVTMLNYDFDGDLVDEQIVATRNLLDPEGPILITYIRYNANTGEFIRTWTSTTEVTRPNTLSISVQDMIGDHGICIIITGMNHLGDHILTIFRRNPSASSSAPFAKIAEFTIDGSITILETERSQAYQMGMARGQSFSVVTNSRDTNSENMMDQVEIVYAFNEPSGLFEQRSRRNIPGAHIEQQRVRELLGNQNAFENFIYGLWYFISPQGTIDTRQFIYFDPFSKEIIFYGDETQQIFAWESSYTTRLGLFIRSQNISVATLRRSIDIEMESLESIRIRTTEQTRLRIRVNAPWDGSYRKVNAISRSNNNAVSGDNAFINAVYDSTIGRFFFHYDGNFTLLNGNDIRQGKYAFYNFDNREVLELRDYENRTAEIRFISDNRETFLVESFEYEESENAADRRKRIITLSRVRLGAMGIQELHDASVTLTLLHQ